MRKIKILLVLMALSHLTLAQLDPLYSQSQFNQLMINPAYAGIYNHFSASFISRLQWAGLEGAPTTNTLTAQSAFKNGSMGLGAIVVKDELGINSNLETQLIASYNIKFPEATLGMGIQGGIINYTYDLSKLTLDYLNDERLATGLQDLMEPNFGFGIIYRRENFYSGLSIPRLKTIEVNDGVAQSTRYYRHFYLSTGFVFEASRFTAYKIAVLIRHIENVETSADISLSTYLDETVWAGITARGFQHFGLFVALEVGDRLKLGYSFELPSSSLIQGNYGSHEISITFDAPLDQDRVAIRRKF